MQCVNTCQLEAPAKFVIMSVSMILVRVVDIYLKGFNLVNSQNSLILQFDSSHQTIADTT